MAHIKTEKERKKLHQILSVLLTLFLLIAVISAYSYLVYKTDVINVIKDNYEFVLILVSALAGALTFYTVPRYLSLNDLTEKKNVPISDFQRKLELFLKDSKVSAQVNKVSKPERIRFIGRKTSSTSIKNPFIEAIQPLENNINNHIKKLQNNSIINLIIGIIGTIITISVLSLNLLTDHTYRNLQEFIINFIPKLSFVIIIQLFAFFFLRLYKSNLDDTKYFQNELTNIMAKTIALKIAYQQEDRILINELTRDLSKVERNFKLAAGESLLNIEKSKIEKDFDLETLKVFKDFLAFKNTRSE